MPPQSSRAKTIGSSPSSPPSLSTQTHQRQAITRRLTGFYVLSLSAIATLTLLGHYWIQRSLAQQALDIQIVSSAQEQQMLMPRLADLIMAAQTTQDSNQRQQILSQLATLIEEAEPWQQSLPSLAQDSRLSPERRAQIQQMVMQLVPEHQQILASAKQAISGTGGAPVAPVTPSIPTPPSGAPPNGSMGLPNQPPPNPNGTQGNRPPQPGLSNSGVRTSPSGTGGSPPTTSPLTEDQLDLMERNFMRDVDGLILAYNQQAIISTQRLANLEKLLLVITLAVLAIEGVFVFRPAVKQIQNALKALADSLHKTQETSQKLSYEKQKSEKLLLNILPQPIAHRLKNNQQAIADGFSEVTVLFADIVGFTKLSAKIPPQRLVELLNQIFSAFDHLAEHYGLEKIKTIGDAYMAVGGLPVPRADHAEVTVAMALGMQRAIAQLNQETGESFSIRIGINTGPVVAGVIGVKKFIYDLWGDTVNIASRMESHGVPGSIQITDSTYALIKDKYIIEPRGTVMIKGKGEMMTYWVKGVTVKDSVMGGNARKGNVSEVTAGQIRSRSQQRKG